MKTSKSKRPSAARRQPKAAASTARLSPPQFRGMVRDLEKIAVHADVDANPIVRMRRERL